MADDHTSTSDSAPNSTDTRTPTPFHSLAHWHAFPRPATAAAPRPPRRRHPTCYFDDYVVLSIGSEPTLFRIQRSILHKYSNVLSCMLESPNDEKRMQGSSDQRPLRLPDDDPNHFAGVLSIYHGTILIPRPSEPSFEYITGILRVAKKYAFSEATDWALDLLRDTWSLGSSRWLKMLANPSESDVRRAITLVNLSRELRINEFLGGALYLLCTDETLCGDPAMLKQLGRADVLLMIRGTQSVYRFRAQLNSFIKPLDDRAPSTFTYPLSPPPANPNSYQQPPPQPQPTISTWREFVCNPATMQTVFPAMGFWAPLFSLYRMGSTYAAPPSTLSLVFAPVPAFAETGVWLMQCVSAMPEYVNYSFEEIRLHDYQVKRETAPLAAS
ncbi:hypothetical protein BOTBODRAFT_48660 [Botryobasidium botryosum FD-172 SS1]|uniref:BTB domain-containing protein n=1 Tax=Botryobasidium botryosum (strain FD-172 SS1) TaxID=930990 RepID=A0A067LZ39_BOTB1|nr:hypothetical protein BOTBODRAFT_48660 [Botryobasidium botryosum FD-172 SS1]